MRSSEIGPGRPVSVPIPARNGVIWRVLAGGGRLLKVAYKGSEPPPDTFKDDAQALAEGTYGRDGVFHATALQAKCASKYAPGQPGVAPKGPATSKPAAASNAQAAPADQTAAN